MGNKMVKKFAFTLSGTLLIFWNRRMRTRMYNRNSFVTTEIGEGHELLVSKIKIHMEYSNFTLFKYEGQMNFGSNVKIEINSYKT
jgi:hypothetical protein